MSETTSDNTDQAARDQAARDDQSKIDQAAATVNAEQQAEAERLAAASIAEGAQKAGAIPAAEPEAVVAEEAHHSNVEQSAAQEAEPAVATPAAPAAPAAAAPVHAAEGPAVHQAEAAPAPAVAPPAAPGVQDVAGASPQAHAPGSDAFVRETAENIMRSGGMGDLIDATSASSSHVLVGAGSGAQVNLSNYVAKVRMAVEQAIIEERARMERAPSPMSVTEAAINQHLRNLPESQREKAHAAIMGVLNDAVASSELKAPESVVRMPEATAQAASPRRDNFRIGTSFSSPLENLSFANSWQNGMRAASAANAAEVERSRALRASEPMAARMAEANRSAGAFAGLRDRLVSKARAMSAAVSSALFTASFKAHQFLTSPAANTFRKGALAMSVGAVAATGLLHAMPWAVDHLNTAVSTGAPLPSVNLHGSGASLHDHFASMGREMAAQDVNSLAVAPTAPVDHLTQYASLSNNTADSILKGIGKTSGINYDFASMHMPSGQSPLYASIDPGRYGMPSSLIDSGAVSLNGVDHAGFTQAHVNPLGLSPLDSRPPMPDFSADLQRAAIDPVNAAPIDPSHVSLRTPQGLADAALDHPASVMSHSPDPLSQIQDKGFNVSTGKPFDISEANVPSAGAEHGVHHGGVHHGHTGHVPDGKISTHDLNDLALQDAKAGRPVTAEQIASLSDTHTHAAPGHHAETMVASAAPVEHGHHGHVGSLDHQAAMAEKQDVAGIAPSAGAVHQQALADISHTPAAHAHDVAKHAPAADTSFAASHAKAPEQAVPGQDKDGFNMHFVGDGVRSASKGVNEAWAGMEKFFGLNDEPAVTPAAPAPAPSVTHHKGPSPF